MSLGLLAEVQLQSFLTLSLDGRWMGLTAGMDAVVEIHWGIEPPVPTG
jgi:hypothetical protein